MSKAFTSEETGADPVLVRARPPLPAGSPNYVTPRGLAALQAELADLERQKAAVDVAVEASTDQAERLRAMAIETRLTELLGRIHGATVVAAPAGPADEVRFGATVSVRDGEGQARRYQIVGVDEADARQGRVAFSAPLGRALLGLHRGEVTTLRSPRGEEELEVMDISYDDLV